MPQSKGFTIRKDNFPERVTKYVKNWKWHIRASSEA